MLSGNCLSQSSTGLDAFCSGMQFFVFGTFKFPFLFEPGNIPTICFWDIVNLTFFKFLQQEEGEGSSYPLMSPQPIMLPEDKETLYYMIHSSHSRIEV